MDIIFGIFRRQNVLLSDISHVLNENIKLVYTIERLSDCLESFVIMKLIY